MATTSLWSVKGNIGAVIRYAENLEKTLTRRHGLSSVSDSGMDSGKHSRTTASASSSPVLPDPDREAALLSAPDKTMDALNAVLSYAARSEATGNQRLVTGINCTSTHAISDMLAIKRAFSKMDGTVAYHGYQSFREGEVTPEQAHEIGVRLAQELWGDWYQVLVATHMDKPTHIHNHFCINTVSFVDGKKFFRSNQDYRKMREVSDRLCRENHLSIVRDPQEKGKHYAEWKAEQEGKSTWRSMIRADIDKAIEMSMVTYECYEKLSEWGYEFKYETREGKPLKRPSLKPPGSQRFFRFDKLGKGYDEYDIVDRIQDNKRYKPFLTEERRNKFVRYRNEHPPTIPETLTGFGLVLFFFAYMLGIVQKFPEVHPDYPRLTKEDREAIMKLEKYDAMVNLMAANHLNTLEDVIDFRKKAAEQIDMLSKVRRKLHDEIREYRPAPAAVPAPASTQKTSSQKKDDEAKDSGKTPDQGVPPANRIPEEMLHLEERIREINEEIRRIRKLIRISENLLENSERVRSQARGFGIHERADGSVRLETPEEQLQSFDRKIDRFYDTLEQEAAERAAERRAKNRQRDGYER